MSLYVDILAKSLRLYDESLEVTRGAGLYAAICIGEIGENVWVKTVEGEWEIQKKSEKELILVSNYKPIPIVQVWTFRAVDENFLEIKIDIEIKKSIFLVRQDVVIELTDKYKKWITSYEEGDFYDSQYALSINP